MLDAGRGSDPGAGPGGLRRDLPRDARGRIHGGRRVPLPRLRRGGGGGRGGRARPASSSSSSSPPTPAAGSSASARTRRPTTCARWRRCAAAGARVGLAPHSVRACPRDWLEEIGRYAEREGLVLHVHADEQPREIEECLAEHGLRPHRAARRAGLPRPAHDRRPRHACLRRASSTSWPSTAPASASARRPRRTSATASRPSRASSPRGDPALHRLGLERPHRPARGAARAGGNGATA